MRLLQTIIAQTSELRSVHPGHITVVGIDGPTAAGKTTLADALTAALRENGISTWTFQLDWALKGRSEREADVAHLRRAGAAFEFEGELHMRLDLAAQLLDAVARFNRGVDHGSSHEQEVSLTGLYSRAAGGTMTGEATLTLRPGMVLVIEGHYTLRTELDEHIDLNVVLLSAPNELLTRKVDRVKGYRSPDDAIHYFWHTDLPSFNHHLRRFGGNADLIVDNSDYRNPKVIGADAMSEWLAASASVSIDKPRRLQAIGDIATYVLSESLLVPDELSRILTATIEAVVEWDKVVGRYLRIAVDEVTEDLESVALREIDELNSGFSESSYRAHVSYTDALVHVYRRKLPLALGLEIRHAVTEQTMMTVLAEIDRDSLHLGVFWQGGVKWIRFDRSLGGITTSDATLLDGTPHTGIGTRSSKLKVFLPTQFAVPSFLEGVEIAPVFIGREQENISASRVLGAILQDGGVWIHRFALHREIRYFQYCLAVEGVPSLHVGNYLIAVKTADPALRRRFREFRREWSTPIDRVRVMEAGRAEYDLAVENERADARAYFVSHCKHLAIRDGSIFGNLFDPTATSAVVEEIGSLLRSPFRILRKRAIEFLDDGLPGLALPSASLWPDVPDDAQKSLSVNEFTGLSSSIMAEIYLWLALRNERSAVLGANVYDIRPGSLDARAFLDAAAEHGCPIVLQCSLNAVGQRETEGDKTYQGYLQPQNGVEDFISAAKRAARDLYLLSGKRPPLFGIGLDHINAANDRPARRAKRFLQQALKVGGLTHVVLDGSDLFQVQAPGREELTGAYRRMNEWVLDLMDAPSDTFLKDMEVCISELNYMGTETDAYVPSADDIRLFADMYGDALDARGFGSHVARPKLFISNLGTRHHSSDEVRPWVERSREWRDVVKGDGFVSAVLHGTSRSHQDTLSAATVGCHKVNVAGDFLDTIVEHLPQRLSRRMQEGPGLPKTILPSIRPEMDRISDSETQSLYQALKAHCGRVLKTIASPKLTSMDASYFQYRDFDFSPAQVEVITAEMSRALNSMMPKAPGRRTDSRLEYAFAASMIEVPYEEFRGPILDALWDAGIRHFHVDEGDGAFIARRFSGVEKVRYLRKKFPSSIIHAHLMVMNPHYPKDGEFSEIQQYADAGVDGIAIHVRSCGSYREGVSALRIIRRLNLRAGIVVETSDAVDENLEALIRELTLDWVVVMGVPIGYGGQVFHYSTLNRISRLHDLAGRLGREFLVECDGGLNLQNIELCRNAGGQLFAGWSIIKGQSIEDMERKVGAVRGILTKGA